MEIDPEIIKKAIYCSSKNRCISDCHHTLCKVKECINDKIYFLECVDNKHCNYRISFGQFNTCSCPIRQEIYNKYKI